MKVRSANVVKVAWINMRKVGDSNRRIIYKMGDVTNLGTIAGDATSRRKSRDVAPR